MTRRTETHQTNENCQPPLQGLNSNHHQYVSFSAHSTVLTVLNSNAGVLDSTTSVPFPLPLLNFSDPPRSRSRPSSDERMSYTPIFHVLSHHDSSYRPSTGHHRRSTFPTGRLNSTLAKSPPGPTWNMASTHRECPGGGIQRGIGRPLAITLMGAMTSRFACRTVVSQPAESRCPGYVHLLAVWALYPGPQGARRRQVFD